LIGIGDDKDNAVDLGSSSVRFDDVYATNGTIQTSDRNQKQDIAELSDAEKRVAVAAKGLLRKYRWIDAVAEKGDNARIHFGIIAQDLEDAFTAEGLDAGKYAMFISTTWWEHEGEKYNEQAHIPEGVTATEVTRRGVRYPELLAFIIASL
jgi:ribosomal protein L9